MERLRQKQGFPTQLGLVASARPTAHVPSTGLYGCGWSLIGSEEMGLAHGFASMSAVTVLGISHVGVLSTLTFWGGDSVRGVRGVCVGGGVMVRLSHNIA